MTEAAIAAFPARMAKVVDHLSPLLFSSVMTPPSKPFCVSCGNEILHIPIRIYHPAPSDEDFRMLGATEQAIVACWFTRHHDGHTRERFLSKLPAFDNDWVIAYIVVLCGEYVIEILNRIWESKNQFNPLVLGRWLDENQPFLNLIRGRTSSYWDCYYRRSAPRFDDYVGKRLLSFFDECLRKARAANSICPP